MLVCTQKTDDYTIYSSPMNIDGKKYNLRIVYVSDGNARPYYKICGTWRSSQNKAQYRYGDGAVKTLSNIEPIYKAFGTTDYVKGKSFRVSPLGLKMEEGKLKNGEYKINYSVTDIYGKVINADPSDVTVSGDEITKK